MIVCHFVFITLRVCTSECMGEKTKRGQKTALTTSRLQGSYSMKRQEAGLCTCIICVCFIYTCTLCVRRKCHTCRIFVRTQGGVIWPIKKLEFSFCVAIGQPVSVFAKFGSRPTVFQTSVVCVNPCVHLFKCVPSGNWFELARVY